MMCSQGSLGLPYSSLDHCVSSVWPMSSRDNGTSVISRVSLPTSALLSQHQKPSVTVSGRATKAAPFIDLASFPTDQIALAYLRNSRLVRAPPDLLTKL